MTKLLLLIFLSFLFAAVSAQKYTVTVHQPEPLQIKVSTTELRILRGNKIVLGNDITVSGGSGHYEMIWSGSDWKNDSIKKSITIAPTNSTVYSLVVNDQFGCSLKQLFQVNVISPLQLEFQVNQISCFGNKNGTIKTKIIGGAPPFNITWSSGKTSEELNNLPSGEYTVTVSDNLNQKQVKTITIKEPAQIITRLNTSICQGSSYQFAGIEHTQSGQYQKTVQTKNGCDSTIILNLTVNPVYTQTIRATICQGSSYSFAGIERTTSGKYQNTFQTKNGCDSTVILNLTVNLVYTNKIQARICQGSSYSFAGIKRTTSGKYQKTFQTINGCDSTVILNLTVNPVYTKTIQATICQGSSYFFAGIERTTSGQYQNTFQTKNGCDSIIILNLSVNPANTKTILAQICEGGTYEFAGIERTLPGQYQNTIQTKNGCDSIVILNLSVNTLPDFPIIIQKGDTLLSSSLTGNQWLKNGNILEGENKQTLVISSTGTYKVSVCNSSGCSLESTNLNAIKTGAAILSNSDFSCKVFPIPNNGIFTVELKSDKPEILVLELYTAEGKSVIKQVIKHPSGKRRVLFGKSNLADGAYNLQIKYGTKTIYRRIIVN